MTDYRGIIAKNLISLRTLAGLTQAEVASKLSYSDKAVSKWERAESIPDIAVLKAIADMYGVTVDYLLAAHGAEEEPPQKQGPRKMTRNKTLITIISVVGVWFLALVIFAACFFSGITAWQVFLWAAPVSLTVALVLTCVWGGRNMMFIFISALLWALSAAIYITWIEARPWLVFIGAGILEVIVVLAFGIRLLPKSKDGEKAEPEEGGKGEGGGEA